jgi:hypothetical protein
VDDLNHQTEIFALGSLDAQLDGEVILVSLLIVALAVFVKAGSIFEDGLLHFVGLVGELPTDNDQVAVSLCDASIVFYHFEAVDSLKQFGRGLFQQVHLADGLSSVGALPL